jgi:hypothetical protein
MAMLVLPGRWLTCYIASCWPGGSSGTAQACLATLLSAGSGRALRNQCGGRVQGEVATGERRSRPCSDAVLMLALIRAMHATGAAQDCLWQVHRHRWYSACPAATSRLLPCSSASYRWGCLIGKVHRASVVDRNYLPAVLLPSERLRGSAGRWMVHRVPEGKHALCACSLCVGRMLRMALKPGLYCGMLRLLLRLN